MLQARSHLFCAGRCEDGAGNTSGEETVAHEASEPRFMPRTTAADNGNVLRLDERRGVAVDNFVGGIEQERWIGKGKRVEGRKDGMCGINKVMLCCWGEMSTPGQLLQMC